MAQHDYDIANQSGANFRADLNNALDAIVSNNSGTSEPSTTFAYEWWIDTTNNLLKLRNSANNAWITLPLSITADNSTSGALTVNGNLTTTGTIDVNGQEIILDADADTSITADTDDQIDFRIGGTDVATLTNSHLVLKGTTPKITIGDGGEEDTALIFDGNAQDFYIGLDDSADDLIIGRGSTVGTNADLIINGSGQIGIGITPTTKLDLEIDTDKRITFSGSISEIGSVAGFQSINSAGSALGGFGIRADTIRFATGSSERLRIDDSGNLLVGKATNTFSVVGGRISGSGAMTLTADGNELMNLNRLSSDGALVYFSRQSSIIGTISVSSGFVTYGNFMGSHYTETSEDEILLGTVMEFTGDLVEDKFTTGKQLSKAKISDTEESKNVYGVYFANHEDETGELISSLGASFCRINKDVTVDIGDLLVSNGDGTAKVQDDDLIKSKTIGKVTSTQKRDIYDDGSYTIPVVLYCG